MVKENAYSAVTADDAAEVREALLSAAPTEEDGYGNRYVLAFEMKTAAVTATVRSGWIIRRGEDFPRLTSCFVL